MHASSNNERNDSPEPDDNISPEPPDRPPGKVRQVQVHPEQNSQVMAYDTAYRKKNKPKSLPLDDNQMYNHLANSNVAMSPMYPLTPNICVEGGKIEFIKSPPVSARNSMALGSPPQTPLAPRRGSRDYREVRACSDEPEKFDGDKIILLLMEVEILFDSQMNFASYLVWKLEDNCYSAWMVILVLFFVMLVLERREDRGLNEYITDGANSDVCLNSREYASVPS
ncbi:unnamed protein product [Leptidea sinapis]|uniref:Uncharacterized protein n=1 Tax=Leptidea sinapis TaxID=189913 RepID=A0A5E4QDA2_9NEOP|nr:unnamed protein product [Leptidea sinapis]